MVWRVCSARKNRTPCPRGLAFAIEAVEEAGDNLIQVIDPDGNVTAYGHDSAGHVISITDVLGNTLTRTFDDQGRLSSETAGNNAGTYAFSYDDQGRVVRVDGPFGLSLTFAYDTNGNRVLVLDSLGGSTGYWQAHRPELFPCDVEIAKSRTGKVIEYGSRA